MPFKKGNTYGFKKGVSSWLKGTHIQTNTGKTHFKKGQKPANYKGGISRTREYLSFYKLKYKILKKDSEGSHTFREWELLKKQYGYKCPCCNKKELKIKLKQEHIIPLSKGGSEYIENIQPLCGSCNSRKNTKIIKY